MEKEKKENIVPKKKRNIILFFILMVLAMLAFDVIMDKIYPVISSMIIYGKYGRNVIIEAVCAFIILFVILLFKNSYIFNEKKQGFIKSLKVGGFITVYATLLLTISISEIAGQSVNINDLGSLILFCLLIGIFEEFLCRGWIQNEFIERFANTRKQVILSILLSALIFGGIHISNIWIGGQTVIETMAQIIQATGMGFLLGAIYYRTKNIWSVVFLHGYWDFALFLGELNIIKACTEGATPLSYKIVTLSASTIIATMYFVIGLYVLRKCKTQGYIEGEQLTEEELTKSKKQSKYYVFGAIALYLSMMFLPVIETEETCYNYETKNIAYKEIITPVYSEYTIKELNLRLSITDDLKLLIHNLNTEEKEYFDKNDVYNFLVIEDDNKYKIMIRTINDYGSDTIIYYSDFITKDNFNNESKYLKDIIKSFKVLDDAPTTNELKYIISTNNEKLFVIETLDEEQLVLFKDKFYILKHQENTEIEEDSNENDVNEEPITEEVSGETPVTEETEIGEPTNPNISETTTPENLPEQIS